LSLADLSRQLDALRVALRDADDKAVRSRHRYEVAYAKAFLSAEASNAESRKQIAVLATEIAKLDAELADAVVRDLKRGIDVLRERIHVGQSYGAAVRSEWGAS
jgi:hypothetical protein